MKPDTICGAPAVAALFARRPQDALRLFYTDAFKQQAGPWCATLAAARKPYRMLPPEQMEKVAATPHHGGVAVVANPRDIPVFNPAKPPDGKLLLVLDGIGNPHNLGAIARSAAFFGVPALVIGDSPGAALPSDAAYRTAEGGLDLLQVYRCDALPAALVALSRHFLTVAASLSPSALTLPDLPRDKPIVLVLGNEEHGISGPVLSACRRRVRIDGSGQVQSLNVAQAAAVLLHTLMG